MLPTLEKVLEYKNPSVLARYLKDYPDNELKAEDAFNQVLKFLWLCQKYAADKKNHPNDESLNFMCAIHTEMTEIDDMWHTFILFTKDYTNFGMKYFGTYLHHAPSTAEDKKLSPEEFKIDLEHYLSYVYDNLGEETLRKWFAKYL